MDSTILTGILLIIAGLYAVVRGIAMGKPISKRNTFREIGDMWVGIIGFYAFALGLFIITIEVRGIA